MHLAAIICEYNPFHKGHAWQIREVRKQSGCDAVLLVMSGNYVQRGAPAITDLHTRTRMALSLGGDAVLELPVFWSSHSAAYFAQGAVSILSGLNCVDSLWFGSEAGDTELYSLVSGILAEEPEAYSKLLRQHLKLGLSYPLARQEALISFLSDDPSVKDHAASLQSLRDFLSQPNNILGLEYCIALRKEQKLHPDRKLPLPCPLKRVGAAYHEREITGPLASASAIRIALTENDPEHLPSILSDCMPPAAGQLLLDAWKQGRTLRSDDLSLLLGSRLLNETPDNLTRYVDVGPELANRIYRNRFAFQSFDQFVTLLKTRELTYSHISRALLHIALNLTEEPEAALWIRVLGFSRRCPDLLKTLTASSSLPVITRLREAELLNEQARTLFQKNLSCQNLYELLLSQKSGQPMLPEEKRRLLVL